MRSKIRYSKTISNPPSADSTFNFDFDKVISYCESIKTTQKRIMYLEYVLKEKKNSSNDLDIDLYSNKEPFEKRIKSEIRFYRKLRKAELEEEPNKEQEIVSIEKNRTQIEKIVWLKNKQDLIFLFDQLIQFGFVPDRKDKDKFLFTHFTCEDQSRQSRALARGTNHKSNKSIRQQLKNNLLNPSQEMEKIVKTMVK